MNEQAIFLEALEFNDPAERSAYLIKACAGNAVLLQKVKSLLASHEKSGDFLDMPVLQQMSDDPNATQAITPIQGEDIDLSYLTPSTKPDSLGTLGHYEIIQVLGQGAFGTVLKAFDEKLHRFVAIKVLNRELASTSPPRKRFVREARSVAAIKNENVIAIYSVEEEPLPYIVMEFVDGGTLQDKMDESGPIPVSEILHIGKQIASGLAAAHAVGLIHRDIKPANILLEKGILQKVKITDFGLARAADDASMTQSGMIAGTPLYMAPEQARGGTLDPRTDQFSLGSVLYALAAGHPPFRAPSAIAVLRRIAEETPRPIQEVMSDIPDWLVIIIKKLLAKQPEDRFASAQELADVLSQCQSELQAGVPVTATNKFATKRTAPSAGLTKTEPKHNNFPLAGIAAGALMTLALMTAGFFLFNRSRNNSPAIVPSAPADVAPSSTVATDPNAKGAGPVGNNTAPVVINPDDPPSTYIWKPIPLGDSPFDKLDPAAIPKEERFDWQPKELVGVIGSHARRQWAFCNALSFSSDGKQVITHHTNSSQDTAVWDVTTGSLIWTITTKYPISYESGAFLFEDGKCLVLNGLSMEYQFFDKDGKQLAEGQLQGRDGKPIRFGKSRYLCENGKTLIADSFDRTQIWTYSIRDNSLEFQDEIKRIPSLGEWFQSCPVAIEIDQLFYVDNNKVFSCPIENGKFGPKKELAVTLPNKESFLTSVTPDGKKLVISALGDRGGAEVWDIGGDQTKVIHRVSLGHGFNISPDGRWLVAKRNTTWLYRLDRAEPDNPLTLDSTDISGGLGEFRFSPDGSQLVLGNYNGLVRFWDLSGPQPKELSPFDTATAFPIPNWLQSTSLKARQGQVLLPRTDRQEGMYNRYQIWDLNGTLPAPGAFLDTPVEGPVHPLGQDRFVQIAQPYGQISRQYRWKNSQFELNGKFGSPSTLGNVSPDGRTMVVYSPTDNPKQLEGWDLSTDTPKQKWMLAPKDQVLLGGYGGCKVWFSADNRWFATQAKGDKDGGPWKVVLWRNTGAKPEIYATLPIECSFGQYHAAISPDGRYLAHTPKGNEIVLFDLTGKEPREIAQFGDYAKLGSVAYLAFHPDGKKLAAVGSQRGVCILDVATMKPVWDWQSPGPVHWLDWAADGRHLVTHNGNMTVYVLRLNLSSSSTDTVASDGKNTERMNARDSVPSRSGEGPNNTAPVVINPNGPLPATFKNSIGMEFVKVPKGTAWLGGGSGQPGTTKVDIEQDFYLGKYEVTQEEWEAVTGQAPSHFSRTGPGADAVKDISDEELKRFPVEFVSWEDCQLFIERLNKKEKDTGRVYRLPKEAEWEHACRGAGDKLDSAFNFTSPSRRIRCCQARLTLNIQKR
jgi:serine/threonine protein kinase/WD40 repeat protein